MEDSIKWRIFSKEFQRESIDFYRGATVALLASSLGLLICHFASDNGVPGFLAAGQAFLIIAAMTGLYTLLMVRIVKRKELVEE